MERIEILMPFESKDLTTGFRMTGEKIIETDILSFFLQCGS